MIKRFVKKKINRHRRKCDMKRGRGGNNTKQHCNIIITIGGHRILRVLSNSSDLMKIRF